MTLKIGWRSVLLLMVVGLNSITISAAEHAAAVTDYRAGDGAAAGFTDPAAAIGEPARFTGEGVLPGVVSAFNPPYLPDEIVSIGEGGSLSLQLAHFALPIGGVLELGAFTNVGLIDADFPLGQAGDPLTATEGTFGADSAVVEVSADGAAWVSLGEHLFDVPTIGYADVTDPFAGAPGAILSGFGEPFAHALGDLAGRRYHDPAAPDILDLFAGRGGGVWLDLSSTGLERVGWVRFSVPDDGDANTHFKFELDAIAVANAAVGPPVPEPATLVSAVILLVATRCIFGKCNMGKAAR